MLTRKIPNSQESIPVIGLGTWDQFDVGSTAKERGPLREVLAQAAAQRGTIIDSSPMYGRAEETIGDLTNETGKTDSFFFATKVWTTGEQNGIDQMNDSIRKMRRKTMDLMQIHNLVDWKTHLRTLQKWKEEGKIRYFGITHYTVSAHNQLEEIIRSNTVDFVQFNYSIITRNAERSLLSTAMDSGVAVIVNEPFEKGSLFASVQGIHLPEWSSEYGITNWTEFFLKYIIAHPAVTCVIPGTSNPKHLDDNLGAGMGILPNEHGKKRMVDFINSL